MEQDRKDILRIMQDVFYKTDPSSVYTKVSEASKISLLMQEMTLESLSENLSFVAKERNNQKLLGKVNKDST